VVVERNAWTLPQERYNAHWVRHNGFGLVVRSWKNVNAAVEHLLEPSKFEATHRAVSSVRNRAVLEIPGILEKILSAG